MFRSRHSPLHDGRGPKDAVDPINCALNLGYAFLEAETKIACHAAGLDPALGLLHADRDARLSFIYDLMEPCRPVVDRLVLDFAAAHTFAPTDVTLLPNGVCRLHPQLARAVAGLRVSERAIQDVIAGAVAVLGRAEAL